MAAAARLLDAASGDELSGEGSAPSRRGCAPARRHSAETTLGGICEWQHWHEETEADSWRGTELRNGGKAALDDGRHLSELRKRERGGGSDNAKREGFCLGAHRWRRPRGKDVAAMTSQLEVMA
uniref:Uncharacterized protein n=1 Tax=Oryza rufipogon TaxID=4529 RepID=A0A0E0R8G5_ORYRU